MIRRSPLAMIVATTFFFSGCGEAPREQSSQTSDASSSGATPPSGDASPPESDQAATSTKLAPSGKAAESAAMTIVMNDCKASRPGKITSNIGVLNLLLGGPPKDKLVKRGTVSVDGREYALYLPKADSYSRTNDGANDSDLENTSTLISIDQNADGKLTDDEGWFANLPLRLGDTMFDVAEIAKDGSRLVLKGSDSPLRGVIIGRTCPPFSFETAEGKEISLETYVGKAFILDIWSFT